MRFSTRFVPAVGCGWRIGLAGPPFKLWRQLLSDMVVLIVSDRFTFVQTLIRRRPQHRIVLFALHDTLNDGPANHLNCVPFATGSMYRSVGV